MGGWRFASISCILGWLAQHPEERHRVMADPSLVATGLNPVLVIISLIFWFWMWGVPGAILAVPMLAIAKIICDGVKPLNAIGHFLEGDSA